MSIVTRLHCDGCHREIEWWEGAARDRVPGDWHYWSCMDRDESGADDAHLCSWDCVVDWVHRRRPVSYKRCPIRAVAS